MRVHNIGVFKMRQQKKLVNMFLSLFPSALFFQLSPRIDALQILADLCFPFDTNYLNSFTQKWINWNKCPVMFGRIFPVDTESAQRCCIPTATINTHTLWVAMACLPNCAYYWEAVIRPGYPQQCRRLLISANCATGWGWGVQPVLLSNGELWEFNLAISHDWNDRNEIIVI